MDAAQVRQLKTEIAELELQLASKKRRLAETQSAFLASNPSPQSDVSQFQDLNNHSPPETKIVLFRSFFQGREDVYAKRFESKKTGKSGY
jgi:hypothetical protein